MTEELEISSIICGGCGSDLFKVEFRTYKNEKRWVTATCAACGMLCVRREIDLDIQQTEEDQESEEEKEARADLGPVLDKKGAIIPIAKEPEEAEGLDIQGGNVNG